ncbi:cytochrome b [Shimia biformata]|uniref:cytochrome b n=1 Tax=Shimia biformata TaxID=1294299 RepID=UPI001951888B|nr:cytochrome b [Shimia biformata]
MAAYNNDAGFGWVTRGLHWLMALALIAMLVFGTYLAGMEPALDRLWMYGAHKTVGFTLLVLSMLRIGWHAWSPPPGPIPDLAVWQLRLSRAVQRSFYALMLALPLSGWVASSATGIDTVLFNRWVLPPIAPVSEQWESVGFIVHGALGKLLALLVIVHVVGAFWHRNGTLRRMLFGHRKL